MQNKKIIPKTCSFCGNQIVENMKAVRNKNGEFICSDCISKCYGWAFGKDTKHDHAKANTENFSSIPKPKEIKAFLDEYVIGQEAAKRALSVAVYNHYKRTANKNSEIDIQKSNVMLIGPTGSGKTYLAQTLAKKLGVPFAIAAATSLTEAGYVGDDVESVLFKLLQNAEFDVEKAKNGIVYIDEIDKIARKSEMTATKDISGEGVQNALLKVIEGTVVEIPVTGGKKFPQKETIELDTNNILFICGGAFSGIDRIVNEKTKTASKALGFNASVVSVKEKTEAEIMKNITPQDLVKFGMTPEFVGRVPVIVSLDALDEDALVRIITEPKNAIAEQYRELFRLDGIALKFSDDAVRAIAKESVRKGTGARGIRAIMENTLKDLMFELPGDSDVLECIIKEGFVKGEEQPTIIRKRNLVKKQKRAVG